MNTLISQSHVILLLPAFRASNVVDVHIDINLILFYLAGHFRTQKNFDGCSAKVEHPS